MPIEIEIEGHGVFEFPDGTPEDVIQATVRRETGGRDTSAAPDAPKGLMGQIGDRFRSTLSRDVEDAKTFAGGAADLVTGAVKGIGQGAVLAGRAVQAIPGVTRAVDTLYGQPGLSAAAMNEADRTLQPSNMMQSIGQGIERGAEFALMPGKSLAARMAGSAALTAAHGGGVEESALSAGMEGVLPGAAAAVKAGKYLVGQAEPLAQAGLKPTLTALKGASGSGTLDAKAKSLVRFIIDNRLTSPDKAQAVVNASEGQLRTLLASSTTATDAPQRAMRYLDTLERSAKKQALPESDVAAIRNAAAELIQNKMGEDVITMVARPHPTLVGPTGQPIQVLVPTISRALRTDVGAAEALESARASSQWGTKKQWGEMKGASTEATKAVERAQRDAVKVAVPEARDVLKREGQAIQARNVLERAAVRMGNRDTVSLPSHVIAAGEIASGKVPIMAFAANWLRNNQLKAGIYADRLGAAIQRGHTPDVIQLLKRIGVSLPSQVPQEYE